MREVQNGEATLEAGGTGSSLFSSPVTAALPFLFASCFLLHCWRHCTTTDCPTNHGTSAAEF